MTSGAHPAPQLVPPDPASTALSPRTDPAADGFLATVRAGIGGPIGRYAAPGHSWWTPPRLTLLVATVCYLIGMTWRLPCRITEVGQSPDTFRRMCYSDIGLLYEGRGLLQGNTPYLDSGDYPPLEYPVLTGWFLEAERLLTRLLGGAQGPGLSDQDKVASTLRWFDVNQVLLGVLFLIAVWALAVAVPERPWDAMMLAASPCVAAAALINWDLLAIALTALACLFWARRRPGWAGVMIGLGMAAKLYPGFLLGPLLLLCLRAGRLRAYGFTLITALTSWLAVNLPVLIMAPEAWRYFWTFNSDRGSDLGSVWYVLSLAGREVTNLNLISYGAFALLCAAIAVLIIVAPRRPRFGSVAFLVVVAFLLTAKVYSPQYVLWLLGLLVLARPRWRDWWIFTAGELIYFGAIWWHLGGFLNPGGGEQDRVYWAALFLRLLTQLWVATRVVRDVLHPHVDVVRRDSVDQPGADDPWGGVLDRTKDVPWWPRLRRS